MIKYSNEDLFDGLSERQIRLLINNMESMSDLLTTNDEKARCYAALLSATRWSADHPNGNFDIINFTSYEPYNINNRDITWV